MSTPTLPPAPAPVDGKIVFTAHLLNLVRAYVIHELERRLGVNAVRPLNAGEYIFPNTGFVPVPNQRVARDPQIYEPSFPQALTCMINDLAAAGVHRNGPLVLDLDYCDERSFAAENAYGDYIYLTARLVRK